ncbi:MAG: lipid II flippase Amj family protein [Sphingorhabdus sp.]
MDWPLINICLLTLVIHLIGALAYAARIAGVRTHKIALSFALFNVLVLVSRTSNSFLGPFLAKRIENGIVSGGGERLLGDLRIVLFSATIATILGALAVPTVQRWFSVAIGEFHKHRSVAKLLFSAFTPTGRRVVTQSVTLPKRAHAKTMAKPTILSWRVIAMNVVAQALLTVGVIASLYAGYLYPEFRVTASQLSAVVNGFATILLFVLIDPQLSVMTDDVVEGRVSEPDYRRTIVWLSMSRVAGTLLAQALLLPSAWLIVWVAMRV